MVNDCAGCAVVTGNLTAPSDPTAPWQGGEGDSEDQPQVERAQAKVYERRPVRHGTTAPNDAADR